MKLSIIIPAYNEEKRIEPLLRALPTYFKNDAEIIIVINNTTDRTEDVVKKVMKDYKSISYFVIPKNKGKGESVIEGFKKAKGEYVCFIDADSSADTTQLNKLYQELQHSDYAGIIGSRWIKGAKITKYQPLPRIIASRGYNLLVRILLGLPYKDTQCGLKIFRKEPIQKIMNEITPTNAEFDVSLLYTLHKHGYKVKESPIIWEDNADSAFKMRQIIPKMFKALLEIRKQK